MTTSLPRQPPASDEIEVSVLGRGYGEAIVVHYGDGQWLAVDSLNDAAGRAATLGYFDSIGVSPENLRVLVATHWHDDHVRGLSQIFDVAINAEFYLSIAMDSDEWRTFYQGQRAKDTARVSSGLRELRTIAAAQQSGRAPAKYAIMNRTIRRVAGTDMPHGADVSIEALAPVDADIRSFLHDLSGRAASVERVVPFSKNDVSVPLWLRVGAIRILLGADLEVVPEQDRGWNAVYASDAALDGRASIVKVAHHGSANGHHEGIWTDHVETNAYAILSPWNRGSKLPKSSDVERIAKMTGRAYSSSRYDRKSPGRAGVVTKMLKTLNQTVRARPADVGQVRLRFRPNEPIESWRLDLMDGALPLTGMPS